ISIETLSVSMSARISSTSTWSPTCLCHTETVPSATVSPSCGINTFTLSSSVQPLVDELPHLRDDALGARKLQVLEVVGRGERHVRRRYADDRSIEIPEELVRDDRGDFGAPAAKTRVLLDGHKASRLRDLAQDRLRVERHERAHVDDGRVDAVLALHRLRGLQTPGHPRRQRNARHILAVAQHLRLAELVDVLTVRDLALRRIERLLLEEEHGVVVADRGGEQSLHVGGRRR